MRVGSFDIHALETSYCALDGGAMFGVVPKVLWQMLMPPDSENRIPLTTRSLLLLGDDRRILVDTGNGDKWSEKLRAIYAIDTESVNITSALSEFELMEDDITDVICTHLHFDHAGGNTCLDESGSVIPAFPNARYWIQKSNWERANAPFEKDKASYRSENWEVLAQNGMFKFVDGAEPFIPGIDIELFEGHTDGQQLPRISDGETTVFFCGDLFPTAAHLNIPWIMAFDNHPVKTLAEKKRVLAQAADQGWILVFEHDKKNEAVTVVRDGERCSVADFISLEDGASKSHLSGVKSV